MMLFASALKAFPIALPERITGPVCLSRDPFRRVELIFTSSITSSEAVLKIATNEVSKCTLTDIKVLDFWDVVVLPILNEKSKFLDNGTFDKTMWCDGKISYELV